MVFAEYRADAEHLFAVADGGSGRVALEILDARGRQRRGCVRRAHGALLARGGGREQSRPTAIVGRWAEEATAEAAAPMSPEPGSGWVEAMG